MLLLLYQPPSPPGHNLYTVQLTGKNQYTHVRRSICWQQVAWLHSSGRPFQSQTKYCHIHSYKLSYAQQSFHFPISQCVVHDGISKTKYNSFTNLIDHSLFYIFICYSINWSDILLVLLLPFYFYSTLVFYQIFVFRCINKTAKPSQLLM